MTQNNQNSNWKKLLEFRNMQEKLENSIDIKIGKKNGKLEKQLCQLQNVRTL